MKGGTFQHLLAVGPAPVENHAHESQVVADHPVESGAPHLELRVLRNLQRHPRSQRAVLAALVNPGEPRWTGTGRAVVVEAFQHRDLIQVGDDACGRSVQVEASPLDNS